LSSAFPAATLEARQAFFPGSLSARRGSPYGSGHVPQNAFVLRPRIGPSDRNNISLNQREESHVSISPGFLVRASNPPSTARGFPVVFFQPSDFLRQGCFPFSGSEIRIPDGPFVFFTNSLNDGRDWKIPDLSFLQAGWFTNAFFRPVRGPPEDDLKLPKISSLRNTRQPRK